MYQRADKALRNAEEKEERVMLLEAWKEFEVEIYVCDNPRLLYPPVADSFQSLDPISLQSRIFRKSRDCSQFLHICFIFT